MYTKSIVGKNIKEVHDCDYIITLLECHLVQPCTRNYKLTRAQVGNKGERERSKDWGLKRSFAKSLSSLDKAAEYLAVAGKSCFPLNGG